MTNFRRQFYTSEAPPKNGILISCHISPSSLFTSPPSKQVQTRFSLEKKFTEFILPQVLSQTPKEAETCGEIYAAERKTPAL